MQFIQELRIFFSICGYPAVLWSDNGWQIISAERELHEMVEGFDSDKLCDLCSERSIHWLFTAPASPYENGCAEALAKSCKRALKKAIGEQVLSPFELCTWLLEVGNLVNQRPIRPFSKWTIGRVIEVHPGTDGRVIQYNTILY